MGEHDPGQDGVHWEKAPRTARGLEIPGAEKVCITGEGGEVMSSAVLIRQRIRTFAGSGSALGALPSGGHVAPDAAERGTPPPRT